LLRVKYLRYSFFQVENAMENKANGARAKNAKMTQEERKALSLKMVEAKKKRESLPKETHTGTLKILDLPCSVLDNEKRVLSMRRISEAFTGKVGGGMSERDGAQNLPRFLASVAMKPFISKDLMVRICPVEYAPVHGGRSAFGIEASLLPEICEVVLDAHHAGKLKNKNQAKVAELLLRGFARVGIIALVDEATGYQKDRARDALAKILEQFVAKELQPWVKTFPAEYYEHLFRLYGYPFPPDGKPNWRPQFFGTVTNNVIYARLAPELLPELKKAANKAEKRGRLHQWLTNDIGHPKLREHLASIVTLLKISSTPDEFKVLVNRVHPKFGDTMQLDL
jgi:hypothetical protein